MVRPLLCFVVAVVVSVVMAQPVLAEPPLRPFAVVEFSPPPGPHPASTSAEAIVAALVKVAENPGLLDSPAVLIEARRALVMLVESGVGFTFTVFDLASVADDPPVGTPGRLSALSCVIELRLATDTAKSAVEPLETAIAKRPGWVRSEAVAPAGETALTLASSPPWARLAIASEGPRLTIALGDNALQRYRNGQAQLHAPHPLVKALGQGTPGWNITGLIDLDVLREAWPAAAGFGRTARVLSALNIANMRALAFRGSLPLGPSNPQLPPPLLKLSLATSPRSQPPGVAHVRQLADAVWPLKPPAGPKAINPDPRGSWAVVLRPEWGEWVRSGIAAFGAAEPEEAARAFPAKRAAWESFRGTEALRRITTSLAPTLIIERAAPGVFVVNAPTRALEGADDLSTGLQSLLADFAGPGSPLTADRKSKQWTLHGAPSVLADGLRFGVHGRGIGGTSLRAVVDLGGLQAEFDRAVALHLAPPR